MILPQQVCSVTTKWQGMRVDGKMLNVNEVVMDYVKGKHPLLGKLQAARLSPVFRRRYSRDVQAKPDGISYLMQFETPARSGGAVEEVKKMFW